MPSTYIPTGQDWDSVNVGRSTIRAPPPKTAAEITRAKAAGLVNTEKRYGAGGNTSAHSATVMSARKLEETDELKHQKVDKSLSQAIQQGRAAKKMTQKDLATKINEKPQVIQDYESGKAIPNGQIIVKIERALGCKLPRSTNKKPASSSSSGGAATSFTQGGVRVPMSGSGLSRGGPPKRR